MAIYRHDMAIWTYGPEDALGGYKDKVTSAGTALATPAVLSEEAKAGESIIIVDDAAAIDVGDYIMIGAAGQSGTREIRRVLETEGTTIFLDYSLGYMHSMGEAITEPPSTVVGDASCSLIPGAYESVTLPDVVPEFNPRYFLNQNNDRNWTYMYRGRETLNGSASNIILLDGTPLVYLLGAARHHGSASPYTHVIYESAIPSTMTWDLQLRDSNNNLNPTEFRDFNRRYVGGILNRGMISANEGEWLTMSWDDVLFSDMIHNQINSSGLDSVSRSSDRLIVAKAPNSSNSTNRIDYPEGDPYYFSGGEIKFFGIPFARVRSFRLEINNNIEPRYYFKRSVGKRGPTEFQPQNRQITMSVSLAMADTQPATATVSTLWKEFILQGNYENFGSPALLQGFNLELVFSKGINDEIRIISPYIGSTPITDLASGNTLTTATIKGATQVDTDFGKQGCFFRRISHNLGTESPIGVDGEIIMRNVAFRVLDSIDGDDYPI